MFNLCSFHFGKYAWSSFWSFCGRYWPTQLFVLYGGDDSCLICFLCVFCRLRFFTFHFYFFLRLPRSSIFRSEICLSTAKLPTCLFAVSTTNFSLLVCMLHLLSVLFRSWFVEFSKVLALRLPQSVPTGVQFPVRRSSKV